MRTERFLVDADELVVTRPQCVQCIRFHGDFMHPTCDAFSGLIPAPIWMGSFIHTEPYPGDHGLRFERVKETPSE